MILEVSVQCVNSYMKECLNILDQLGKATDGKLFGFSLVRQSIYLIQV